MIETQRKYYKAIASKNPVKIIVHFNKVNMKQGFPWTVHIRGVCIPAAEVVWDGVAPQTVWKPEKPTNPRGWIECKGSVTLNDNGVVRITR